MTDYKSKSKCEDGWKKSKKLGSLTDDDKDVGKRKQLAAVVLNKLNKVLIKDNKQKTSNKIKLYKTFVKSILLYN